MLVDHCYLLYQERFANIIQQRAQPHLLIVDQRLCRLTFSFKRENIFRKRSPLVASSQIILLFNIKTIDIFRKGSLLAAKSQTILLFTTNTAIQSKFGYRKTINHTKTTKKKSENKNVAWLLKTSYFTALEGTMWTR